MKRILGGAIALILLGGLTATATASHPTLICLDIEPDEHFGVGNDHTIDYLTASVGATDAGHPPEQEGCVISDEGSAEGTVVHFEVTGENDPDDSDTPETPDLTCTVPAGSNSCTVAPPEGFLHDQEIAAWIDFDPETVEVDREEGPDEATEPGAAEPDATDVALWRWTHEEPQPQCNDGEDNDGDGEIDRGDRHCYGPEDNSESVPTGPVPLSIRHDGRAFEGWVAGWLPPQCTTDRKVRVKKKTSEGSRVIGSDLSGRNGKWRLPSPSARGRFFAVAPAIETTNGWGDPMSCFALRSPTVRVR